MSRASLGVEPGMAGECGALTRGRVGRCVGQRPLVVNVRLHAHRSSRDELVAIPGEGSEAIEATGAAAGS